MKGNTLKAKEDRAVDPRTELKVVSTQHFVRIELENNFYITMNQQGMIIGSKDGNAYVSPPGIEQIVEAVTVAKRVFKSKRKIAS